MVMGNGLVSLVSGTLHERLDRATGPSRAEAANCGALRWASISCLLCRSIWYGVQWVCTDMYYYVVLVGIVTCMYGWTYVSSIVVSASV